MTERVTRCSIVLGVATLLEKGQSALEALIDQERGRGHER